MPNEINSLIADMQTKPELKDLYFSLLELSEVSENLKPLVLKKGCQSFLYKI